MKTHVGMLLLITMGKSKSGTEVDGVDDYFTQI